MRLGFVGLIGFSCLSCLALAAGCNRNSDAPGASSPASSASSSPPAAVAVPELPAGAVLILTFDKETVYEREGRQYVRDLGAKRTDLLLKTGHIVPGKAGEALELRTPEDVVETIDSVGISGSQARTLALWLQDEAPRIDAPIALVGWGELGFNRQFALGGYGPTYFLWGWGDADWRTKIARTSNWKHHVITYTGSEVHWYVDGVDSGETHKHTYATADNRLGIGRAGALRVDELVVFNRAPKSGSCSN